LKFKIFQEESLRALLRTAFRIGTVRLDVNQLVTMRLLAREIFKHRLLMLTMFVANALSALCEGGTMAILALAVAVVVDVQETALSDLVKLMSDYGDALIGGLGRGGLFLVLVVVAIVTQIAKSALGYAGKYVALKLQYAVSQELQEFATKQAMEFSYAEIGRHPAGMLAGIISQTARVVGLVGLINTMTLSLLMMLIYLGLMVILSIPLMLAALGIIVVLSVAMSRIISHLRELGRALTAASLQTSQMEYEFLQAPRLLRVFNATDYAQQVINSARRKMIQAAKETGITSAIVDPIVEILTIGAAGIFLIAGYFLAGEAAINLIPKMMVFLLMLNRMMPHARSLNQVRMAVAGTMATVEVLGQFFRTDDKSFSRVGGRRFSHLQSGVYFENVSFRYPEAVEDAVSNISFVIPKGQTVALVGSSGAGKSTIADLFLGLQEPTTGRILIDHQDLKELNVGSWLESVGTVDQEVLLLNTSIWNNIAFARPHCSQEEIVQAARLAQADGFISALPDGYNTVIGDRGYRLSGGQQQRLALARALVESPAVLLLDEATSALDTESERAIQKTIEAQQGTHTILVVAHRLSTIQKADRIIVLEHGRLVEQGTFDDLLEANGRFFHYWNLQVRGVAS